MVPVAELVACLFEDPCSDRDDQAALFGHRYEPIGRNQALVGMLPSDESFDAHRGDTVYLHHRLVMKHELTALESPVQRMFSGHAIEQLDAHRLSEGLNARSPPPLGPIH